VGRCEGAKVGRWEGGKVRKWEGVKVRRWEGGKVGRWKDTTCNLAPVTFNYDSTNYELPTKYAINVKNN